MPRTVVLYVVLTIALHIGQGPLVLLPRIPNTFTKDLSNDYAY